MDFKLIIRCEKSELSELSSFSLTHFSHFSLISQWDIKKMSYLELVDKFVNETGIGKETEKKELVKPIHSKIEFNDIPLLTLSEFKDCDFALKIYSSVLNCHIWFCPDEQMVEERLEDDPAAITYTVDEIMNLTKLNPSPEQLRRIHDAKEVFTGSKLTDCNLNGDDHDR